MTVAAAAGVHAPALQLFCFAHAGGAASLYRRWSQVLPAQVQVVPLELPGHGARRDTPAHVRWPALIDAVCAEWRRARDPSLPFAVFGHSMGALIGFELLHALRARGLGAARWFGASASVAPACRVRETHWLDSTIDQMIDKLRTLGGTPDALLADRDLIGFLMPTLRADFHLCGTYAPGCGSNAIAGAREPLDCALTVFTGRDDPATARADDIARWRDETRGAFAHRLFDGGHFYLDGSLVAVLQCVADALSHGTPAHVPTGARGEAWMQ
jgi:surfactin synthase thioesterase subunit